MKKLLNALVFTALVTTAAAAITPVQAGKADVVEASARAAGNGSWSFAVTVKHADSGWSHYADNFEILGPDGTLLGRRVLVHPHVNEQPFTRSLGGVKIPEDVKKVHIRAHDKVHGFGGREIDLTLER